MQFESSVAKTWKGWDHFGSDYHFYDCTLNPDFFTKEQFEELSAIEGQINVCISFVEESFIQISIGDHWFAYEFSLKQLGETSRGLDDSED